MRRPDLVGLVEAAYELAATDDVWLANLAAQARSLLDRGLGIAAFTYSEAARGHLTWSNPVMLGAAPELELELVALLGALPKSLVVSALGADTGMSTASELLTTGPPLSEHPLARAFGHPHGIHDLVGVRAVGEGRAGLILTAALPSVTKVTPTERRRWGQCAAHLAAALRLRAHVDKEALSEAVLEADGRVAHAEGAARGKASRDALQGAARAMDRARGKLRNVDPDEALSVWRGLVDGRWSLVDTLESDGRRYIVARRNDPSVPDPRALSLRERQVCAFAARGHALKLIAYELGLGPSTVSEHLRSGMRKLGVTSLVELAQRFSEESA